MGISALPACPPDSGPFSTCRLMHLGLVREGIYSSWAQNNIVPAQYVRDEARVDDYMRVNKFLKDINNEREGDEQVGPPSGGEKLGKDPGEPRNATYKANLSSLKNLVLLRFRCARLLFRSRLSRITARSSQRRHYRHTSSHRPLHAPIALGFQLSHPSPSH